MQYLETQNKFIIEEGARAVALLDTEIFHKAANRVYDKYVRQITQLTDCGDDVREMNAKMREAIYRTKALEDLVNELHYMFNEADNAQYDAEQFGE